MKKLIGRERERDELNRCMTRIEREKALVGRMIALYCRHKLGVHDMPEEYRTLVEYAHKRLDRCKFGESKPTCKKCPVHCYQREMREKIRRIMRWAGPRMMLYAPLATLRYFLKI